MLIKVKEFIQKYWISILISWICFWLWMAYYGDNTIVKLVVFPIISFFLVILFHLELERKNIKYLYISIKQLKKRLKIIGDIMKIYKYISIFLLYLFIYIILFIINPWILELINITITLPWSIIEEVIITHLGLNLSPTIDNIFYRRIIHFAYGSISFFINIFLLYKLIYKLKKIFKLYKIN